jgi:hypothetical protein
LHWRSHTDHLALAAEKFLDLNHSTNQLKGTALAQLCFQHEIKFVFSLPGNTPNAP